MSPTIDVGSKAPAFVLKDEDGQTVRLTGYKGRWLVLYFYPKADTPGCTTEACEFSERFPKFEGLLAAVIGISPDEPPALRKFSDKHKLRIRLLSDPSHATLEAYGAWGEKNMYGKKVTGVLRSTVIVDPQGRIAHRWTNVRAAGHAEAVRAKLAELVAA
jgi:thioredoxin-dependent peroxiredoxin